MTNSSNTNKKESLNKVPPVINLTGEIKDAFFTLGLRDRPSGKQVKNHLESLLKSGVNVLDHITKISQKFFYHYQLSQNPQLEDVLKPYADGIGININTLISLYLIPELGSSFDFILNPKYRLIPWGCSTFFYWDEKTNSPLHGRILDFPLGQTYEENQRTIIYQLKDRQKIVSTGLSLFPYPGISAFNESGISLSLHQKFTANFSLQGTPVFDVAFKILSYATNIDDVLKILKENPLITTWGFYLTFKDSTALCIDHFSATNFKPHFFDLKNSGPLYFANENLNQNDPSNFPSQKTYQIPFGVEISSQMRSKSFEKLTKSPLNPLLKIKEPAPLRLLSLMSSSFSESESESESESLHSQHQFQNAANWNQSFVNFGTLEVLVINASENQIFLVPSLNEKFLRQHFFHLENIFNENHPHYKIHELPISLQSLHLDPLYFQGYQYLGRALSHYDQGHLPRAFHFIQMGIDELKNYPESTIAQFYFQVWQYIHTTDDNEFSWILQQFKLLENILPSYLNDHLLLFLLRLKKITGRNFEHLSLPQHPQLAKIFHWEKKLPVIVIKQLRRLIFPQMGNLEIIYLYQKMVDSIWD
jgi:hypothetical protein